MEKIKEVREQFSFNISKEKLLLLYILVYFKNVKTDNISTQKKVYEQTI